MVILKFQPLLTNTTAITVIVKQWSLYTRRLVSFKLWTIWDRETKLSKEGKSVLLAVDKDSLSSKTFLSLPCPQFIRPVSWCSFRPCRRVPVVHRSDDFRLSVAPRQHHCIVQNMYCIIYEWPPPDLFGIF